MSLLGNNWTQPVRHYEQKDLSVFCLSLCFPAHGLGFWTDRSAVHEAAAQGRALQLQQLIQAGAAVNIVAVDSITPLHEACIQGQTQCVRLLLDAGAQVSFLLGVCWSLGLFLKGCATHDILVTPSDRWMRVTSTAAPRYVTPVQLGAWTVSNCCWSMVQLSTLHCLPSPLFMRPAWEVRVIACCCYRLQVLLLLLDTSSITFLYHTRVDAEVEVREW